MEKRTADIIMIVKGNWHKHLNFVKRKKLYGYDELIAAYMSETCGCPMDRYDYNTLFRIIEQVLIDYSSTCTKKSELLFNYFNNNTFTFDEFDKWCNALSFVTVKSGDEYINGFTEELCKPYWEIKDET